MVDFFKSDIVLMVEDIEFCVQKTIHIYDAFQQILWTETPAEMSKS